MADIGIQVGKAETTTDFIAVAIIAAAIGFIVYEVVQGVEATEGALGGYLGPLLIIGAVLAGIVAFAVLL